MRNKFGTALTDLSSILAIANKWRPCLVVGILEVYEKGFPVDTPYFSHLCLIVHVCLQSQIEQDGNWG